MVSVDGSEACLEYRTPQLPRHFRATSAFLAAFVLLTCLAASARAGDRVYWANGGSPNTDRISFANLDGSGGGNLSTAGASSGQPRGLAIDVAAGKVYWTIPNDASPTNGRISFANLDGSGAGGDLNTTGATINRPNAAAVYPAAGRIYWANEFGDRISFANLNNTGGGDLVTTGATLDVPIAPVVDPGSGRIYWGNANPVNVISFANLDGSGGGNLNTAGATVRNPHGLAVDPVAGRIYWANIGTTTSPAHTISYANLNGTGGGNLNTSGATVNVPVGVAIDPAARRIYWANHAGNSISFANLDGGGGGDLSTLGATLQGSRSPVLLKAPSGAGAPQLTGGSTLGSELTCSPGSWAQDLLGSWLYRAPQTLAYSWTRDGAGISGASGNTYTARSPGVYRCTVTASNPAGSSSQASAEHAVASPRPPGFGRMTRVQLGLAVRRIRANGPLRVVIKNGNGFPVSGKLSAQTARSGRGSRPRRPVTRTKRFAVGAHARKTVKLKLTSSARRVLKRKRKLSIRLVARVRDPAGDTRTVRQRVSLRLKTRR